MRRHSTVLTALIALCVITAAGCGGDDSNASSETTAAERSSEPSDKGDNGDKGDGATGGSGSADDCTLIGDAFIDNGAAQALGDAMSEGTDPTEAFQKGADALAEVKGKVSSDLQGPVSTLADAYQELAETTSKINWEKLKSGDPAEAGRMQEFAGAFSSKDTADAATELTTWVNENCQG